MSLKKGIELIVGPMLCGKTGELLRRLRRMEFAKEKVQLFKLKMDNRYAEDDVSTHDGLKMPAIPVENTSELIEKYNEIAGVIGIDEIQFFDEKIINFLLERQSKHLFILSGLPLDFRGEPFKFRNSEKHMGNLMPYTRITSLDAICNTCGEGADFTQRLINNKPASYNSPLILVGGSESYEARCIQHFYKPIKGGRNKFINNGKIITI